jgi:hypothetical protein
MSENRYRVDPKLVPPVALAMAAGALLILLEGPTKRGFLLLLLLSPFYYLGAEVLARKIILDSEGITVSKFLRSVRFSWAEILSLDAVKAGSKIFVILETDRPRPTLITNTISPFSDMVSRLLGYVPQQKIAQGAMETLADPPTKIGPVVQAWIVCLVLTALVVGKLLGYSS